MVERLTPLCLDALPTDVQVPDYARGAVGTGIVHLGAGAFFKAHQAVYTDSAIALEGGDWGICAVSLNSLSARETLAPQDGLYTLKILGDPAQYRVIGAIKEVLAGPEDRTHVIERIASPSIHIVTLTVTEKGYCLTAAGALDMAHKGVIADLDGQGSPVTVIGILAAALAARYANGAMPVTIISCDNISENGTRLGRAVNEFAQRKDKKLAGWIADNVAFPNTMVDSITPASDDALVQDVADATGYEDRACIHREEFSDWVIEDFSGPRPAWEAAGVIFSPDVSPYEAAKLRLVNAPHSALTYLGLLAGHESVAQVMADKALAAYFQTLTEDELIPSLGASQVRDLGQYRDRIAKRFANTSIHHRLEQIAHDGSVKLPQRLLPPLAINHKAGRAISQTCLAIAAWMRFVMMRARGGTEIVDPLAGKLTALVTQGSDASSGDVERLLSLTEIFPQWIARDARVSARLSDAYGVLCAQGVNSALSAAKKACKT